jgi:hypothetical protein
MLLMTIGSRKTVPFRMLRMVPLGLFHISLRLNSATFPADVQHLSMSGGARAGGHRVLPFTRCSSGVIVAHLMPTLYFCHSKIRHGHHFQKPGPWMNTPRYNLDVASQAMYQGPPTLIASAASIVTWSEVLSRLGRPRS